jgi:hypothetical protein
MKNYINKQDCWLYAGYLDKQGYAYKSYKTKGKVYTFAVYRVMYENFVGKIAPNFHIDHLCNARACINPAHLESVSQSTNLSRRDVSKMGFASDKIDSNGRTGKQRAVYASEKSLARHRRPEMVTCNDLGVGSPKLV